MSNGKIKVSESKAQVDRQNIMSGKNYKGTQPTFATFGIETNWTGYRE